MLFSSLIFLIWFLPAVTVIYYTLCKGRRSWQNVFLLMASLGFYAWGEPWFVLVMMLSILCNWLFGLWVSNSARGSSKAKGLVGAMLLFNLTIIFIFKYLMFTLNNLNGLLNTDFTVPKIMLPIGISFFTFQAISYVLDIYRGKGIAQKNPLNVGLYISFFPQLIAGPIVRYETIADQIQNRRESLEDFSYGVTRFITGFLKKVLLANNFALVADKVFNGPDFSGLGVGLAWLGAICYTLQIYYDFSGYSDMAIGLGRMFGFKFIENFNYPYISKSTAEFWRRWHISLGTWFRDYVYFPLGGSRVKNPGRLVFNLFVVWALTGLWHGANWTFILWGLLYFVTISLEKLTNFENLYNKGLGIGAKHLYTMVLVVLGWVLFRSGDLGSAIDYYKAMFGMAGGLFGRGQEALFLLKDNFWFLAAGIVFSMPVAGKINGILFENHRISAGLKNLAGFCYSLAVTALFIVAISYLVKGAYNPFIYFNF